jgi:tetratricopeptide (TPR) repeat protein
MKNIFYIFALLLLPCYAFAEETWETIVRNILNDKTIEDPYVRFKTVNDTVRQNISELSFEEARLIYYDILLPFVDKKVKDDYKHDKAKGTIFTNIFWIYNLYGYPGDPETNDEFLKKLVKDVELIKNDTARANIYRGYGAFQSGIGNIPVAHEYYYKAIDLYESIHHYERVFLCLYNIAEKMSETRNTAALRKVIEQMQYYIELPSFDVTARCLYHFYAVRGVYYTFLFEDHPKIIAYNDSALMDNLNTINLLENNEIISSAIYTAYYNTAVCYHKSYPDRYDSVYYFLDKTLEYKTGYKHVDAELKINVYIFYAKLLFEQKKYEQAEKNMLYALSLLEELNNNNTAMEFSEVYQFLAMYYETVNRPHEALKYQKLLLENETKRYDNDKIVAMDDMLVKYETEKKEEQIDRLTERTQTAKKILILTISLIAVLLIALLFFIRFHRVKKKR